MKCKKCGYEDGNLSQVHTYSPSSATAYMASFSHICNILKTFDGRAIKDELICLKPCKILDKPLLDEKLLDSYVRWDILEKNGIYYELTTLGKEFFLMNKKWQRNK